MGFFGIQKFRKDKEPRHKRKLTKAQKRREKAQAEIDRRRIEI